MTKQLNVLVNISMQGNKTHHAVEPCNDLVLFEVFQVSNQRLQEGFNTMTSKSSMHRKPLLLFTLI